jgi:hypothetical protein
VGARILRLGRDLTFGVGGVTRGAGATVGVGAADAVVGVEAAVEVEGGAGVAGGVVPALSASRTIRS